MRIIKRWCILAPIIIIIVIVVIIVGGFNDPIVHPNPNPQHGTFLTSTDRCAEGHNGGSEPLTLQVLGWLTCRPWGGGKFGWKWWAMIHEKDWFASVFGRQTALKKQRCHDMSDSNTLWGPVMETLLFTVSRKHPPGKKGPNKGFVPLVHGSYIE